MTATWIIKDIDNGYIVSCELENGVKSMKFVTDKRQVIKWLTKGDKQLI